MQHFACIITRVAFYRARDSCTGRFKTDVAKHGWRKFFENVKSELKKKKKNERKRLLKQGRRPRRRLKRDARDRFFDFFLLFAVESERASARGKSALRPFLRGLLRFKVDLRAATASFGFDHRRWKKLNDQWSRVQSAGLISGLPAAKLVDHTV